ncbi:MAG TPA: nucleotidyltransferase domain-containing protein [Gaiellaceae bacterium]|nr:nucleotidyltransferase domain-containing protein [Gaiellaceae bacterium]
MSEPTAFPDLNAVLGDLVESLQTILAENFCGAYLQGSFAVGDADEHSDVDFIVVTHEEVSGEHVAALQAMQERLYALETTWAQHLEGSYFPKELLRRVDPASTPLVYFDNGATEPVLDNHCNTGVVRWSLRPHPAGPGRPARPVDARLPGRRPGGRRAHPSLRQLRSQPVATVSPVTWATYPRTSPAGSL